MSLKQRFETLLSHLNSEENGMALDLLQAIEVADERLDKLDRLEAFGVDNWSGYGDAMEYEDE